MTPRYPSSRDQRRTLEAWKLRETIWMNFGNLYNRINRGGGEITMYPQWLRNAIDDLLKDGFLIQSGNGQYALYRPLKRGIDWLATLPREIGE